MSLFFVINKKKITLNVVLGIFLLTPFLVEGRDNSSKLTKRAKKNTENKKLKEATREILMNIMKQIKSSGVNLDISEADFDSIVKILLSKDEFKDLIEMMINEGQAAEDKVKALTNSEENVQKMIFLFLGLTCALQSTSNIYDLQNGLHRAFSANELFRVSTIFSALFKTASAAGWIGLLYTIFKVGSIMKARELLSNTNDFSNEFQEINEIAIKVIQDYFIAKMQAQKNAAPQAPQTNNQAAIPSSQATPTVTKDTKDTNTINTNVAVAAPQSNGEVNNIIENSANNQITNNNTNTI